MESTLKFQRGDIYFVRLDNSTGSEQSGTRPAVILQNDVGNAHSPRLALTTSRKWRKLSDGTLDDTLRIRYTCYGKLRKQTDCTGQTGYTMHILDEIIDKMVRQIFSRLRGIPKEQLITSRYAKETAERKNHLQALQTECDKAEKDLLALKAEILAVIKGESAFPKDTLAEMIAAQEKSTRSWKLCVKKPVQNWSETLN